MQQDTTAKKPSLATALHALAKPEWVFSLVALLVLVPLAMLTPAGANFDEPMHILRVDQIYHGDILPVFVDYQQGYPTTTPQEKADAAVYGGPSDKNLALLTIDTNTAVQMEGRRYTFPTWNDPVSMSDLVYGEQGTTTHYFTNTAINSPVVYLPFFPGLIAGEALHIPAYWLVVLMRLGAVLFYVACVAACIARIPFGRWALVAIALLPNQLATVSGVTADTVTNVLCIVFVTCVLTFVAEKQEPTRGQWACLGITCALLPLAKIVYSPFLALLALIPICNPTLRNQRTIINMAALVACGLALFALWSHVISGINPGAMWKPNVSPSRQMELILQNPLRFIKALLLATPFPDVFQLESYGLYGGLGRTVAPFYMIGGGWSGYLLMAIALNLTDPRDRMPSGIIRRRGTSIALVSGVAVVCAGLVFASIYLTYCCVGDLGFDGIQARYFIPVALLFQLGLLVLFWPETPGTQAHVIEAHDAGRQTAADLQSPASAHSNDAAVELLAPSPAPALSRQRLMWLAFIGVLLLVEYSLLVHVRFALFW